MSTPKHVAIIMDRNGQWAKKRSLARVMGHREGAKAVKRAVKAAINHDIEVLSLFAFSTENWERPQDEVSFLMKLLEEFIVKECGELISQNIRLVVSGRVDRIPASAKNAIENVIDRSKCNTGLILNIALDYGGKAELMHAVQSIIDSGVSYDKITEKDIENNLYHPELGPVDLLIRTGGEQRISNFMLWQLAYAELYFTDVLWPDFSEKDMEEALAVYAGRKRRFGKTDEQLS